MLTGMFSTKKYLLYIAVLTFTKDESVSVLDIDASKNSIGTVLLNFKIKSKDLGLVFT